MARPVIPSDLKPLLVDVPTEFRRLKASGLAEKLKALERRRYELPAVLQEPTWALNYHFEQVCKDMAALASGVELLGLIDPPADPPAAEPTVTPEQTLREAGIGSERQAEYQRRMSTLLARRPRGGRGKRRGA